MVDLIFAEAAIRGETVGAMALVHIPIVFAVVMAGCVHAFPTALALAAAGVDFDGYPLADLILVDTRAKRHDGSHVFMTGREALIVWSATFDLCRRTMVDDLQVGCANRDRVNAHQHLGALGNRYRFVLKRDFPKIAKHPSFHGFGDRVVRVRFDVVWHAHGKLPLLYKMFYSGSIRLGLGCERLIRTAQQFGCCRCGTAHGVNDRRKMLTLRTDGWH